MLLASDLEAQPEDDALELTAAGGAGGSAAAGAGGSGNSGGRGAGSATGEMLRGDDEVVLKPYTGVGRINFGMSREEVRDVFGRPALSEEGDGEFILPSDHYAKYQVNYRIKKHKYVCEGVLCNSGDISFEGRKFSDYSGGELVTYLQNKGTIIYGSSGTDIYSIPLGAQICLVEGGDCFTEPPSSIYAVSRAEMEVFERSYSAKSESNFRKYFSDFSGK